MPRARPEVLAADPEEHRAQQAAFGNRDPATVGEEEFVELHRERLLSLGNDALNALQEVVRAGKPTDRIAAARLILDILGITKKAAPAPSKQPARDHEENGAQRLLASLRAADAMERDRLLDQADAPPPVVNFPGLPLEAEDELTADP